MRTAVVVGAGIGGLAVAGALARTGWRVTLLERDDRLRPGRAALVLWPNGVRALRALGLAHGLEAIATPVPPVGIRRPNGQWLLRPGTATAVGEWDTPVVVHREDLHDAFIAGLGDQVDIRTGIQVRSARATRERPAVSDGRSTFEADLVVAADGADSVVRRRLAPATSFASAGFAAWRAVIPWYRAPELPRDVPVGGETLGAGHRFVSASLGERGSSGGSTRGGVYWVATAPGARRPEPPETQLGLLRRWFAGWHAPIPALLAATEPDELVHDAVGELDPVPESFGVPVGIGGYALLGDAAHAMTHHLGQGACLALEDAATLQAVLVDAIPGRTLGAKLGEYSRQRRPRVLRVLAQSRRVGSVLRARGKLAVRARDVAPGRFGPKVLDRAAAAASEWRPPGQSGHS
jgi:2-polyprenyl-6-methoxyphenol hydroxylase-like FAD-dependent oxidoreductase